jgi:hypothetical protein
MIAPGDNTMTALAVRQPYASLIASGYKSMEIRTRNTRIRGTIAIYASRTIPSKLDLKALDSYTELCKEPLPRGKIICVADLIDSYPISRPEFYEYEDKHLVQHSGFFGARVTYAWILENIIPIDPVEYMPPHGSVVWSRVDKELIYKDDIAKVFRV